MTCAAIVRNVHIITDWVIDW